ncbi:MAG: hypothetical protein AB7S70_05625 [Hyphomicrobium sp.]
MRKMCAVRTALAVAACAWIGPAWADQTGFADMHTQARVGGKMCMIDHWHYGNGEGRTKAAAQRDAIGSWQSFTDFEYGSDWARFNKAVAKKISCSQSGSGFSCQVEARPCR